MVGYEAAAPRATSGLLRLSSRPATHRPRAAHRAARALPLSRQALSGAAEAANAPGLLLLLEEAPIVPRSASYHLLVWQPYLISCYAFEVRTC